MMPNILYGSEEEVKDENDRRRNRWVDIFATIVVIRAVMITGVTMNSVMAVSNRL